MGTLWTALEGLPDRRTLKGRRYSLASIVALSFAAMLSGANDLRAIWRWGRRLTPKGLQMLGIERGRAPCHATYHCVFRSISAADLERALACWWPATARSAMPPSTASGCAAASTRRAPASICFKPSRPGCRPRSALWPSHPTVERWWRP
ncbi:MAG: transposase family protein [Notoacmeibacter sp.]|nr:transposase family protein [Notoacmeibacter sp.]